MPYKDIEKYRVYQRGYREGNRGRINKKRRERYATDPEFRSQVNKRNGKVRDHVRIATPWLTRLYDARCRCNNSNHASYKYYGGKGIQMLLTELEIEILWKRDHADKMRQPSIDRINPDGDYHFGNCRFIEQLENCRQRRNRKKLANGYTYVSLALLVFTFLCKYVII